MGSSFIASRSFSLFRHFLEPQKFTSVLEGLKRIYKANLLPLEETYLFHSFHSPRITDEAFDAKPMIMLIGQYSTGKTTFIRYLLERDFPGQRIGPEPTTDKFIYIMDGEREGLIPGNVLAANPKLPFKPLAKFGNAFLNRFQCSTVHSPVLERVSFIDTPGILSGEKQRLDRGYEFSGVLEWFAERVDRIVLLFDANKLDISDEFKRAICALKGHDDKVRIVLNKADSVDQQSLMRVYGALMWSLGKVLNTPEVARVYVGSFWDAPLRFDDNRKLFSKEERDFFQDIQSLPKYSTVRKLNDLQKRSRLAKVHAYIISTLHTRMPSFFGKETVKSKLIAALPELFIELQNKYEISPGDFPDAAKMQEQLVIADFDKFRRLDLNLISQAESMNDSIAKLLGQMPCVEPSDNSSVRGGVFEARSDLSTPFGYGLGEGYDVGRGEPGWIVAKYRETYDKRFKELGPIDGKIMRTTAKAELVKSKLPDSVLVKIWHMSDVDRDGLLDGDEFALAMYLIDLKLEGHNLPSSLPSHLVPPSKINVDSEPKYYDVNL